MTSLRISLDPPHNGANRHAHPFGPGDIVAGKAVLTLKDDENIEFVMIEFKGKCRMQEGQGRDEAIHEIPLFSFQKTLFQGPFKMRADVYEYPFSFTFPASFSYKVSQFRDGGRMWVGKNGGEFPLPPSCEADGFAGECQIYYRLTATVPRTFSNWEDKMSLNYVPYRLEFSPNPESKTHTLREFNHRNYRLTSNGIPRPLSKTELIKHSLHRSTDTLTINFTISATVPTRIVLGQTYPVLITVISKDEGLEGIEPEFVLKDYTFRLISKTEFRTPGFLTDNYLYADGDFILSSGPLNVEFPVNTPKRLLGMFPQRRPAFGFPPPSFASLAVKRSYGLELKVSVVCLGDETSFKVHWNNVEVHASEMETGMVEAMRTLEGIEKDRW
jgi:hypothetical protein